MPELEHAGASLEEKRSEEKKVVATDESDLDAWPISQQTIEMTRSCKPPDATPENDDAAPHRHHDLLL
jgi:hypothetical protein